MKEGERTTLGRQDWIRYGLTAGVGALLCLAVQSYLALVKGFEILDTWLAALFVLVPVGVAAAQWLVVRQCGVKLGSWLVVSAGAPTLAVGLSLAVVSLTPDPFGGQEATAYYLRMLLCVAVVAVATPAVVVVAQWLVLRRHISRAGWWVLASALGWIPIGWIACLGGMIPWRLP